MLHPSPRPPREGGDPERGHSVLGVPKVWAPAFAGDADEGVGSAPWLASLGSQ